MRKIILLLFFVNIIFAENIDNRVILDKLNKIENDVNLIRQEMRIRFEVVDKRFESMDKRFESMDKRFEMMQKNMDKRFEMIQHYMDKRFETLTTFMMILATGIFSLIGFMIWDRKTMIEKAKKECAKEIKMSEEFNKKADKEYVDRLIKAMNEILALKDEEATNIFKKYGLI